MEALRLLSKQVNDGIILKGNKESHKIGFQMQATAARIQNWMVSMLLIIVGYLFPRTS